MPVKIEASKRLEKAYKAIMRLASALAKNIYMLCIEKYVSLNSQVVDIKKVKLANHVTLPKLKTWPSYFCKRNTA